MLKKLLITGVGGIGGVNFVRALRLGSKMLGEKLFIVGTDYNPYHILFPQVDVRCKTPKHSDPEFIKTLIKLADKHRLEFLHPHPSVEAKVVSKNQNIFEEIGLKTYLPRPENILPDKFEIYRKMKTHSVPVPETFSIKSLNDIEESFKVLGKPLWIRVRVGAGGKLSLKINSPEEAKLWIKLNIMQGRAKPQDFIIQEYLHGRDIAFDSLWFKGKLITSYSRVRLEYPFKHISLSGITGTPSVAKTIHEDKINKVGVAAVLALDPKPHGFYSVDIKEDDNGNPYVTEVDGKWHTTASLWGYAISKVLGDVKYNLAYLYLRLGYNEEIPDVPQTNLFPENYYLVRQLDSGVILITDKGEFREVL